MTLSAPLDGENIPESLSFQASTVQQDTSQTSSISVTRCAGASQAEQWDEGLLLLSLHKLRGQDKLEEKEVSLANPVPRVLLSRC